MDIGVCGRTLLLVIGLLAPLAAQAQTLRMGVGAQVTSLDPEYHNISPNNDFASMVFGALVDTDGQSRLIPRSICRRMSGRCGRAWPMRPGWTS